MENLIPKTFQLFGENFKVKQLKKVDRKDSWGDYNPAKNIIAVKKGLQQDQREQSYFHEIVHCILDNLGHEELHRNEVFVDTFAKALHQILKSSK